MVQHRSAVDVSSLVVYHWSAQKVVSIYRLSISACTDHRGDLFHGSICVIHQSYMIKDSAVNYRSKAALPTS